MLRINCETFLWNKTIGLKLDIVEIKPIVEWNEILFWKPLQLEFHDNFVANIKECITSVSFSILLKWFTLRKIYLPEVVCDKETPFSYLFIIGMKVMLSSEMLISAGEKGLVQGINSPKLLPVSLILSLWIIVVSSLMPLRRRCMG